MEGHGLPPLKIWLHCSSIWIMFKPFLFVSISWCLLSFPKIQVHPRRVSTCEYFQKLENPYDHFWDSWSRLRMFHHLYLQISFHYGLFRVHVYLRTSTWGAILQHWSKYQGLSWCDVFHQHQAKWRCHRTSSYSD